MTDTNTTPKLVQALYQFKGSNNDELWFGKGDIITITQNIEGGWWEGTLDGKTGWFPSNFVKELKKDPRAGTRSPTLVLPGELSVNKRDSIRTYHDVVLRSLKDTERTFVNDLHLLLQTYLRPLHSDTLLSESEYKVMVGNLEELATAHHTLLAQLDECAKLPIVQQRVGGIFMKMATKVQAIYRAYCVNHPHAVSIMQKHRDALCIFMESKGAPTPGIDTLTTSLSKPFTRLDKYSNMLKELERHTEESHVDRGDTQRAISVYRDISTSCSETRRQKELEFEIMNSVINGWEGEEIRALGDVLLLTHVRVHIENSERKERIFILFSNSLVILSVSPRMSQYVYEGKLPVSGMVINELDEEDGFNFAFEITGSMIDRRVVSCGSTSEKRRWVEAIRQQSKFGPGQLPSKPENLQISSTLPSIRDVPTAKSAQIAHVTPPPTSHVTPPPPPKPTAYTIVREKQKPSLAMPLRSQWAFSCLRPSPPLRAILVGREEVSRSPRTARRLLGGGRRKPAAEKGYEDMSKSHDPKTLEEDAILLKVIEAYCTSARTRHTVNSSILESPQVLIVEEEKIIIEENKGGQVVVEEKSLVDTVYSLKDQVKELKQDYTGLRKDLDEERKARKRLEAMLRKSLRSIVETNYDETISVHPQHCHVAQ